MGAVVMAMGAGHGRFISAACINVVVAANAGGAFSPFGDITTLMVWQKGVVQFGDFFALFVPSLINWLVPAVLISLTIPHEKPSAKTARVQVKRGGIVVVMLFLLTIAGTVLMHHVLEIPPFLGMMTGLGVLKSYGYFLRRKELATWTETSALDGENDVSRREIVQVCRQAVRCIHQHEAGGVGYAHVLLRHHALRRRAWRIGLSGDTV